MRVRVHTAAVVVKGEEGDGYTDRSSPSAHTALHCTAARDRMTVHCSNGHQRGSGKMTEEGGSAALADMCCR